MSEVCGYVIARAEEGPCETCASHTGEQHWINADHFGCGPVHPYLGPPKEVCGQVEGSPYHRREDGEWMMGQGHEFVPATRCETCGGFSVTAKLVDFNASPDSWSITHCPDCVLGLVAAVSGEYAT